MSLALLTPSCQQVLLLKLQHVSCMTAIMQIKVQMAAHAVKSTTNISI